jgi:hypothetical protein
MLVFKLVFAASVPALRLLMVLVLVRDADNTALVFPGGDCIVTALCRGFSGLRSLRSLVFAVVFACTLVLEGSAPNGSPGPPPKAGRLGSSTTDVAICRKEWMC